MRAPVSEGSPGPQTLLQLAPQTYQEQTVHLISGNPSYQKCKVMAQLAAEPGITLNCLPPCSPNQNMVERLWKVAKNRVGSIFDDLDKFRCVINAIIMGTDGFCKEQTENLTDKPRLLPEMTEISAEVLQGNGCAAYSASFGRWDNRNRRRPYGRLLLFTASSGPDLVVSLQDIRLPVFLPYAF